MDLLVVPMDPAYFPEAALIVAGVFTAGAAIHFLIAHDRQKALRSAAASLACFALVVALALTFHARPKPPEPKPASGTQD